MGAPARAAGGGPPPRASGTHTGASAPAAAAAGTRAQSGAISEDRLRELIREIPDFPKAGVGFKDITPLLADPTALAYAVHRLAEHARPLHVDCVVAAEARGFLLGPALALDLGAGFVLARKPGKLPCETVSAEYLLEYGIGQLELHTDALYRGKRVLVHDDLLATGGTAKALCELVEALGGQVAACGFLVELAFLGGRERLAPHETYALLSYAS
ncbi:MAG: adenine phosphoribosyltransferase [Solirubrobacteraceae bacterium]|jgi:adenine phosphoribosyltransferase